MVRMTRSLRKRLKDLRNIPDDVSGSESEESVEETLRKEVVDNITIDMHELETDKDFQKDVDEPEDNVFVNSEDEYDTMEGQNLSDNDEARNSADEDGVDQSDEENGEQSYDERSDDEESDVEQDSEQSEDENSELDSDFDDIVWEVVLDGSVWKKHYPEDSSVTAKGKIPKENILRVKPGPTSYAFRTVTDIASAYRLLLDDNLLDYICECTMKEAQRSLHNDSWKISKDELLAFIAICYARGALGLKNMSVTNIFSTKYGPELIRGTMSRDKFKTIMRFLRFDDKQTRKQRLTTDKFALMSYVWNNFIENCKKCYNPGVNVTVDEQLFPTKTRCPFTQFMKDKPDKFGVKFFLVVDLQSKFILNGFPYTGKDQQRMPQQPAGERVVLRLMEPYFNGGHTVTTDNFFTGINLAVALKEKNLTLIGTANKQRRWLPETAKLKNPKLPLYESNIYLGPDGTTLTLYQSKRNKSVSILSSLHKTVTITDFEKKKPETINYYNETKYGVDVADQMAKKYSVKSPSRRWPVQVFYNILDLAGINAWIIYKETTERKISRLNFLMGLAESLRSPYLAAKNVDANRKNIETPNEIDKRDHSKNTQCNITRKRKISHENGDSTDLKCWCMKTQPKRQHCQTKKCNNKSSAKCFDCKKIICGKCTTYEQRWCIECCPHMCTK